MLSISVNYISWKVYTQKEWLNNNSEIIFGIISSTIYQFIKRFLYHDKIL